MVRALLSGRKTQTRRVLMEQPPADAKFFAWDIGSFGNFASFIKADPRGDADLYPSRLIAWRGDRLYVKEAWRTMDGQDKFSGAQIEAQCLEAGYKRVWSPIQYEADGARDNWIADPQTFGSKPGRYRHARFMPRWASRLTLTVTEVRVQRLQEISRGDAMAEGCPHANMAEGPDPREWFRDLWNSLHGPDAWAANPWVAAMSFTVHRCNIDQMEAA
jgi:hypothetical protein